MKKLKVFAIICPKCKDTVYSRTRHDFRWCSCGNCYIDGGFDYTKVGWKYDLPKNTWVKITCSKQDLYNDWNKREDKYGVTLGSDQKTKPKKTKSKPKTKSRKKA